MSAHSVSREVFFSYAEADEKLALELEKHLSVLKREGLITTWHKGLIGIGTSRDKEMSEHLSTASIILLLLSADFIASDYCYSVEMSRAIERHEAGEAYVVLVLLRPMDDWHNTPIGSLQALPSNGEPVTNWPDSHVAWASVAQGIRSVVQEGKLPPMVTPPPTFPRIWNIPYLRNPVFTGREEILSRIQSQLQTGQATALSQPQAISGLGGIGKTQIALEYAYQHARDYQAVLWTLADSRESLISGYVAIAELLDLPQKSEQDQTVIIQAVKTWLQMHSSWLLILDNADDLRIVREFIPSVFGGHILLTTRAQSVGRLASRIEVEAMSQDVGALFLLRRVGLMAENTPLPADVTTAREICEELGGLPLALDQAGAYIETNQCSLRDYQQRYHMRRVLLLKQRGDLIGDHPEPVATTWSLSFERVEQMCPAAGDLLRVCAYLSADAIPEEVLTKGAAHLGERLQPLAWDPLLLDEAIGALGAYSLLRRDASERTLSVHRLVQAVVCDEMSMETKRRWMECIVKAVHTGLPEMEYKSWPQWERVILHIQRCIQWIEQEDIRLSESSRVLQCSGWYLTERARYREAQPLLERAYQISQEIQGETHPNTARDARTLARLYQEQGKYLEAEPLYEQALRIYEQALGAEHPDTASTLHQLGSLYQKQGKYLEAEPLYERALRIYEQALGAEHPSTGTMLHALASLYQEQGKYDQAEPLYKRALRIYEQALGAEHPYTAGTLHELARLYQNQGKYDQAEPLYKRALRIHEQVLGTEHPEIGNTLHDLARLYQNQGKYDQAEPLYERALQIHEKALGGEHPYTAGTLHELARLYQNQGKYDQAEPLYKRALRIHEQVLGAEHPSTGYTLYALASLYQEQRKYSEAEELYKRSLHISEQSEGVDHPYTASSLHELARLYQEQGKYDQAEPLYERALRIYEQTLGAEHHFTGITLYKLGSLRQSQGKHLEAEGLYERALRIYEQALGAEHPEIGTTLQALASLYQEQGKYDQAEELCLRAFMIHKQALGETHPRTKNTRKRYVSLLGKMGRDEEASSLEARDQ